MRQPDPIMTPRHWELLEFARRQFRALALMGLAHHFLARVSR